MAIYCEIKHDIAVTSAPDLLYYANMAQDIRNTVKRGRPATGQEPTWSIRLSSELMMEVDKWASERGLSRSYAIRRWLEMGLSDSLKPMIYPGSLGEPVFVDSAEWPHAIEYLTGDEQYTRDDPPHVITRAQRTYRKKIQDVVRPKWEALFEFYGLSIAGAKWDKLAEAMVGQHVPGFKGTKNKPAALEPNVEPKGRGRPRMRTSESDRQFVEDVENARDVIAAKKAIDPEKIPVAKALRKLKNQNPDKWKPSIRALENRFSDCYQNVICDIAGGPLFVLMFGKPRRTKKKK